MAQAGPRLALIIDDIGAREADRAALDLPDSVTLAFLPHTPWGREFALAAWREDRELMLHLPMATTGPKSPGPWAIEPELDRWQVQYRVKKALADIPFVSGVNNHMGSAVTPDPDRMAWVMEVLSLKGLYFVDSLTTSDSRAYEQAQAWGIASQKRDVFLDPDRQPGTLEIQWNEALEQAQRRGEVLVIGHPYPETLAFLETALPALSDQGIELVPMSALFTPPVLLPLPAQSAR
ncbi:divergent polysaccharide deacetylase family protein [Ferrimonas balearica]|uniref:divergent polysaccharide deacetylase family protein n=1 Tax=Ferrimonas balearica TaxID=44012 RepID=UPI001C99FD24|nr:divergent polysaccharide deacetylase family protein [Ferrimonas balearica]MBY5922777.1 divergent polysaccharide deacetylase family protein [Ferrimonas balearica]MBY5995761.1 divergent polysaccharide deacetylase family protein [Ferrimonas balearica]